MLLLGLWPIPRIACHDGMEHTSDAHTREGRGAATLRRDTRDNIR
jgi:hypothetical protein